MTYQTNNNDKKQDVETSLRYLSGYMKFEFQKDLNKIFDPIANALHRIASAIEEKKS